MRALGLVGPTPWSAADAPVGLCEPAQEAGQGAGCRPGGLPHHKFEAIFEGVSGGRCAPAASPINHDRQSRHDPLFRDRSRH
jgi:hypothetical protein